ncbi:hypothetical protein HYALB_00003334 [Hymenoscyphus albidus]|uniref:Uncharacterized protein n=1 Tax=Hymenoscyphus albidus TaxID=595503 RepID=A0A9N9PW33_9HELO|nr:hypothetical protein HYALB_00003334 [Hymenoscyphus albidus]
MQFNVVALFAVMAAVASAEKTVTVYECGPAPTAVKPSGVAGPTAAAVTSVVGVASTGVVTAPTATGSPIAPFEGAAAMNGASAMAMIVAGGVALLL